MYKVLPFNRLNKKILNKFINSASPTEVMDSNQKQSITSSQKYLRNFNEIYPHKAFKLKMD